MFQGGTDVAIIGPNDSSLTSKKPQTLALNVDASNAGFLKFSSQIRRKSTSIYSKFI